MLIKLLLLGVALFAVYLLFFKKDREKNIQKKKKNEEITDTLVECPKCGTYVSKDEAILSSGKYFCSKECLK